MNLLSAYPFKRALLGATAEPSYVRKTILVLAAQKLAIHYLNGEEVKA